MTPAPTKRQRSRGLKKAKIGAAVFIALPDKGDAVSATVLRHGRDHEGLYTEMLLGSGETVRVHPENWWILAEKEMT